MSTLLSVVASPEKAENKSKKKRDGPRIGVAAAILGETQGKETSKDTSSQGKDGQNGTAGTPSGAASAGTWRSFFGGLFGGRRRSAENTAEFTVDGIRSMLQGRSFTLNDFDLRQTVGTGTFGRVRVVKIKGSRVRIPLALKIMKKSEVINLRQVEHIRSEKDILSTLHHPFIVNMFATFQDQKRLFLILEYVNGGELFALLRRAGRLPQEHTRFYIGEIALAFNYMHSVFVIYRDLKPENLLLDCQGHIKITDFGFAKHVEDLTWTLCGTPEYLAPEIIQSKGHGKAVDWWALGVLMFELLAGYPPFYDENPMGIYQKVISGKFSTPKHIDVKARDLIKRFLTLERTKRLGCLAGGFQDIKDHKWFRGGWSWEALQAKQVAPPFQPAVRSNDDTSMFQQYPESTESSCPKIEKEEQQFFEGF
ncbi:unnamed protein product [Amoebophrya sp. A25]|nr:unnamed protein product [Amoebophrya sp. A25]|eukprot:GSA25T00020729001.1